MDGITELPDEILSYILTMLSIKDLLKTSIIFRRWRKLCALRRNLKFDIFNVLGSDDELLQTGYLIHVPSSSTLERHININLVMSTNAFIKRVDQFIKNFQGTKIDYFLVNFYLDCKHSKTIDQWLSFAIARRVERIDLIFYHSRSKCYTFNFGLFSETNASTIKHLRLDFCLVCHPNNYDFIPFKNLRSLSLKSAKVDDTFIESLLSNCQRLEELHLSNCRFKSLTLKIESSSLCHLEVTCCYVVFANIRENINLSSLDCVKLTSLEYNGCDLDTLNVNTPLLKSIHLHNSLNLNVYMLLATLPELEILQLDIYSRVPLSPKITQPFKHLKQLNFIVFSPLDTIEYVEFGLLGILTFLQAFPLLQNLSVMLIDPKIIDIENVVKDVDTCSHHEVKVIELGGCIGNWYEIEFVMKVLKYAHKLEQIVLSPYWREQNSLDWNSNPVWFQNGRQRISEKLQSEDVAGREKLVLI